MNRTLKRWHPKFDLEDVEDVPESELPSLTDEKSVNINQLLERHKQSHLSQTVSPIISFFCCVETEGAVVVNVLISKLRKALEEEKESAKAQIITSNPVPALPEPNTNNQTIRDKLISGIPPSLLEKVLDPNICICMPSINSLHLCYIRSDSSERESSRYGGDVQKQRRQEITSNR
jgi:hypothetical protein